MKSVGIGAKGLIGLAVVAAALAAGGEARAHGDSESHNEPGAAGAEGEGGHHGEHGEGHHGEGHHGEEHHSVAMTAEMVLGFGKTPLALQLPTAANQTLPSYERGASRVTSESFLLGTAFHVLPHTAIGVLVPFTSGTFSPPGDQSSRSTGALGNVEIEGEYERHLSHALELMFALGFALPTAQGEELPENVGELSAYQIDQASYDKAALQRAAAFSRGGEVNSLFEVKRFGIIPKIGLKYRMDKLTIAPYVKLENLIATSSSLKHGYLGELVPGVAVGYRVHEHFEPMLRVWANIAYAGSEEEKKVGLALEPMLVAHLGHVRPTLGVIIPVAGPAADPQFIGVRLGVLAAF